MINNLVKEEVDQNWPSERVESKVYNAHDGFEGLCQLVIDDDRGPKQKVCHPKLLWSTCLIIVFSFWILYAKLLPEVGNILPVEPEPL